MESKRRDPLPGPCQLPSTPGPSVVPAEKDWPIAGRQVVTVLLSWVMDTFDLRSEVM